MRKHLIFIFCILAGILGAQVPERPNPPRLYNNLSREFPDFLNSQEAALMEQKLEQFSNQTSNQICIVIVDDLGGYDVSDYAFKLGEKWGVGKADKDNGIVVLIKPTGSNGGRDLFIATGKGLEGAIPDIAAKHIEEEEMTPYLKTGEYYAALDKGTDVLMKLAKGEVNVKDLTRHRNGGGSKSTALIIIVIIVIIILRSMFGGGGGSTFSRAGRTIFWGSMLGGRGGFGGGGSSSGGGWGGFGGGSFGGGGAGSKW